MEYLVKFRIFEDINKAQKIIYNNGLDIKDFDLIFQEFKKNGLQNYLGFLLELITNIEDKENIPNYIEDINISKLIESFRFIKSNSIDLSKRSFLNIKDFFYKIDEVKKDSKFIRFINKWCPSSLRKDAKNLAIEKKYLSLLDEPTYIDRLERLSEPEEKLLGRGSICKTAEEWFKYINRVLNPDKYYLDKLKSSNIKIIYEDDNYLVYKPLDYASYLVPNFRYWCTMVERYFDDYSKMDLIILLNKKEKTKSYLGYSSNNIAKFFDYQNRELRLNTTHTPVNFDSALIEIGMNYYKKS